MTTILFFIKKYACSFGPLSWLITSELFESSIRGRALGFSTIMTYLAGILVSYSFLSVQSTFGQWVPFVGYFVLTILSIFFVVFAVPDTARKDPFTIQTELMEMRFWRKVEPRLTPALGDNHEII
jgi:MFS family permease